MKEFNFTLQIKGEENRIIGNIVQNDTANRFNIRLKDGVQVVELADTDVITVTFKRNNDSVVIDSIGSDSVVVTDGVMGEIAVIPDPGAVINVGIVNVTVEVYDKAGKRKTSARFCYTVTPDFADSSTPEEDDRFPALQNLIAYMAVKNDEWEQAEAERAAGEQLRIENEEGRVDAEKARAEAESKRASEWLMLKQRAEKAISELVSPDITVKKNTQTEYVLHIKDKDGEFDTPNLRGQDGKGAGDMMMNTYDPDGDGVVSRSEISDNGVFTYTHNSNGLTGSGVNGKFKCTVSGTVSTIKVNGASCSVKCGGENSMELVAGSWYSFILDGTTVNFKGGGGGLTDSKLAQATATADKVLAPYTFYSGDKTIKTGTMPTYTQNQAGSVYDSGQQSALFFRNIPEGYYKNGDETYPYRPEIYAGYSDVAGAIGLSADKVMKGNTILGVAGTGSELNYVVVASASQPSNPVANTIWVKSSVPMTQYTMRGIAPAFSTSNGYVYIQFEGTGSTNATLNLIKSNSIYVKITKVYQWQDGGWKSMEAYIYQDSKWVELSKAEYIILNGATSYAGSVSIVITDSGSEHNTGLGDGAWYLVNNGSAVAALANKVTFTGYSKLWFRVLENEAFTDASIGYRTDSKTWLNASGVVSATRKDLSPGQTGDFYINIASGDTSGYILIQQTSQGVGVSPTSLKISKIWLE